MSWAYTEAQVGEALVKLIACNITHVVPVMNARAGKIRITVTSGKRLWYLLIAAVVMPNVLKLDMMYPASMPVPLLVCFRIQWNFQ